jgi:hypothetical protein
MTDSCENIEGARLALLDAATDYRVAVEEAAERRIVEWLRAEAREWDTIAVSGRIAHAPVDVINHAVERADECRAKADAIEKGAHRG